MAGQIIKGIRNKVTLTLTVTRESDAELLCPYINDALEEHLAWLKSKGNNVSQEGSFYAKNGVKITWDNDDITAGHISAGRYEFDSEASTHGVVAFRHGYSNRFKVEDGLDGDTPIPLDDKAIERLTS